MSSRSSKRDPTPTGLPSWLVVILLAAAGGILISLSLPEDSLTVLAWICVVPLLAAIDRCRSARATAALMVPYVLIFGGIYARWLPETVSTFFRVSTSVGWASSLAVYLAFGLLPFALFAILARRLLHGGSRWAVLLGVPALWVANELLRVHLLGGLPWALLGHSLYREPSLIQVADLGGVYAVSFVLAFVNTGVYVALNDRANRGVRRVAPLAAAAVLCAGVWGYGRVRLAEFTSPTERSAIVGVLQPNRAPVYQWSQMAADRALLAYLRQTRKYFANKDLDLIVWPENAIPLYPDRDRILSARLTRFAGAMGSPLVVGSPGTGPDGAESGTYNAAHLITPENGVASTYRKQRLVPFAEYQPWPRSAEASDPRASAFFAGSKPVLFDAAGVRWGPTICLDFVFADVVRKTVRAGAEVLVNLSNDSWLVTGGPGAAVQQHVQAIFRAVENRRDVARATTTGISAGVNAAGVPFAILEEGKAGGLVVTVHARDELSPYTRFGDLFGLFCGIVGLLVTVPRFRRHSRETRAERVGFEPTRG